MKHTSESDIWYKSLYAMYTWKELIPDNGGNDECSHDKKVIKGNSAERITKTNCASVAKIMYHEM